MSDVNDAMDELGNETKQVIAETITEKLEQLKRTLHPEEELNIVDQCAIVAEALGFGSKYEESREELAEYLGVSPNLIYKMNYTHHHTLPEMKTYLRGTPYKGHTAYKFAVMSPESQRVFLDSEKTLERGVDVPNYLSSLQTKIDKEES